MKILITGASGFVGQHVARRLEAGNELVLLARDVEKTRQAAGVEATIVKGSFTDREAVRQAMGGVDVLYHIGARRDHWGVPRRDYIQSNVVGTEVLLNAAKEAGVPKIVYCSTVGVYSYDFQYRPIDEKHPYGKHFSFYHESKKLAEEVVARSGAPVITVRPGWIYGPNDDWGGVTQMLIKLAGGGRFAFVGKGDNRVHPVYIDDVVDTILAAGRSEQFGETFLSLGPEAITFRNYVNAMCDALGVEAPTLQLPHALALMSCYVLEPAWLLKNRFIGKKFMGDKPMMTRDTLAGVTADRVYDTSKASRLLGHTPQVTVADGLARTVRWLATTGRLPSQVASRIAATPGHPTEREAVETR